MRVIFYNARLVTASRIGKKGCVEGVGAGRKSFYFVKPLVTE
ncbi:hypothetical protein [Campylobacter troglodytis]